MGDKTNESVFQQEIIDQLVSNRWLLGKPENYNRKLALYEEDLLGFVKETRTFGTLGVLRRDIRDRGTRFTLCQFKPEHDLNPDTLDRYNKNRLRVVPELVYSPWATEEHLAKTGKKAKAWRIDLVLFVNGIPIVTIE